MIPACPHFSRARDRGRGLCSLGRFGGAPFVGNCQTCIAAGDNHRGPGDIIGAVATPIAGFFGFGCVDPKTKQLRPESGCARRKSNANQVGKTIRQALTLSPRA